MIAESIEIPAESKVDFWQNHIVNCHASRQSQRQYCLEHSLALSTFGYWKRRLKKTRSGKTRFYPLTVQPVQQATAGPSSSGLSFRFGNDKFRLDISEDFSVPTLKKLITIFDQL